MAVMLCQVQAFSITAADVENMISYQLKGDKGSEKMDVTITNNHEGVIEFDYKRM